MAETAQRKIFTKEIDGKTYERVAYSPGDEVKLVFEGWVEKPAEPQPEVTAKQAKESAAKTVRGTPSTTETS